MDDLISRQDAIDALCTPHGILYPIRTIEELPSAERKKGEWIDMNTFTTMYMPRYKCSICDVWANKSNYCPNCGADMRGKADEAD